MQKRESDNKMGKHLELPNKRAEKCALEKFTLFMDTAKYCSFEPIDSSFKSLIKQLNDSGYPTYFSCSGTWRDHVIRNEDIDSSYITLEISPTLNDFLLEICAELELIATLQLTNIKTGNFIYCISNCFSIDFYKASQMPIDVINEIDKFIINKFAQFVEKITSINCKSEG
jgi:hypothetical protein